MPRRIEVRFIEKDAEGQVVIDEQVNTDTTGEHSWAFLWETTLKVLERKASQLGDENVNK